MRLWKLGALALLAVCLAACGGNSTPIGVVVSTVSVPAGSTVTINLTNQVQFLATVTGATTSTVFWQICLPSAKSNQQPTNCTQGVGPAGCTIPTVSSPLVGFGTITSTGLYTAPATIPTQSNFQVLAVSCIKATAAGAQNVQIVSAVVLTLKPSTATIETSESLFLQLTVTGTQNKAVTWTVTNQSNPPVVGGDDKIGFICPGPPPQNPPVANPCPGIPDGTYIAPDAPPPGGSVSVRATSPTDGSPFAQATINVQPAVVPTVTSIDPTTAPQGSVQQDVYVIGTGFFITSTILVGPNLDPVPTTFINADTLRATIPASELTGSNELSLSIRVMQQNGNINTPVGSPSLLLTPVRPAVISSNPDSVPQTVSNVNLNLTGGYYSPGSTTATFNGQAAAATFVDSRHLSVGISFTAPDFGLYPVLVQNAGVAGVVGTSAINLAVRPATISTGAGKTITVGTKPSAIAVDNALHLAVVANSGSGNVSLINLDTSAVFTIGLNIINGGTNAPAGVAIDDMADTQLLHDLALVVNKGDNSLAVIDLVTQTLAQTIDLTPFTPSGTEPITVGVNPLSHRALVVNASTNLATVIDLVTPNAALKCTTPPCVLTTIGGSLPPFFSVGASPAIAVDPRLNWAVVTPGGAGAVDIVDLGRNPAAGDGGRAPRVIGTLNITTTVQGVGINTETHQVLLTDPSHTTLTTFSLLDQSVNAVTFTNSGVLLSEGDFVAAAVNSLDNLGVVVNHTGNSATVVDLSSGIVLRQDISVGTHPVAVVIDHATNTALIVNQDDNNVTPLPLGGNIRTPQIIEASPAITLAQTASALRLTINGTGFVAGSQVLLDGDATPVTINSITPQQIVASIKAGTLGQAHRFIVTVQNPGQLSNAVDLTVIKPVSTGPAGSAPFGVAVDNDRDLAVVTNNGNGSVGIIDLISGSLLTPAISSATTVGTSPEGVAVLSRTGQAVVANNGSNDFTVVDVTGNTPAKTGGCSPCQGPAGVAINADRATAAFTGSLSNTLHTFVIPANNSQLPSPGSLPVDQNPGAVAIDPNPDFNFAAVATLSQSSSVLLVNLITSNTANRLTSGIQLPTGVIFDPLNQFFVVANSSGNNLTLVDPTTFLATPVRVGINPTSLDYNFQTSTLATVNAGSNTMSVIEYTCPPVVGQGAQCPAPKTRAIVGLPDSGQVSQVQQFSVAIDLAMNLAVVADPNNDRVLLIPLPH